MPLWLYERTTPAPKTPATGEWIGHLFSCKKFTPIKVQVDFFIFVMCNDAFCVNPTYNDFQCVPAAVLNTVRYSKTSVDQSSDKSVEKTNSNYSTESLTESIRAITELASDSL